MRIEGTPAELADFIIKMNNSEIPKKHAEWQGQIASSSGWKGCPVKDDVTKSYNYDEGMLWELPPIGGFHD